MPKKLIDFDDLDFLLDDLDVDPEELLDDEDLIFNMTTEDKDYE